MKGGSDPSIKKDINYSKAGTRQSHSPSAIVIGAGFAGIAATRVLQNASFEVVVLESRNRIGGRAYTDYTFGFPVDMGASWLHGVCKENPLAPLIERLGLPVYYTIKHDSVLLEHDPESTAFFDTDGHQVPQELVNKVAKVFEDLLKETGKLKDEFSKDMSFAEAIEIVLGRRPDLRQEGLANKVFQSFIHRLESWCAADADTISLKSWDEEDLLPGGHGLMVSGYYPVLNNLAEGLDIRLNHWVTKVAWGNTGVEVSVGNGKTFIADAAVITVPLGVLKANTIMFEPRLPEWKKEAIADIAVGSLNKIVLHFAKVFWPNVQFLGVVSSTPYECSYFLNLHKATGHRVLVYMPSGRLAVDIEKLSDEAAAGFAYQQLKQILPDATEPVQYLVSRWVSDENSRGSYSYDAVGNPHELFERLRCPVDNLFFAGEATSLRYPGTVHGAFSTGLLAAEECCMHVQERLGDSQTSHPVKGDPLPESRM